MNFFKNIESKEKSKEKRSISTDNHKERVVVCIGKLFCEIY